MDYTYNVHFIADMHARICNSLCTCILDVTHATCRHIQVVIKCAQSADRAHFAVVQLVAIMYNMLRPLFVPVCSVHNSNMQIHVT